MGTRIEGRVDGRKADQLRPINITRRYTIHAAGSVLIECGLTKVICTATVEDDIPRFLKGKGEGWVTAEYGMLPGATHTRSDREAAKGKQSGRTVEIQRLIGRALRASTDFKKLGERSIRIDCDVIQADGGTRCASITGAWIALRDAVTKLVADNPGMPPLEEILVDHVAAVSVGLLKGAPSLDLCYAEDSTAEVDMNIIATGKGKLVEVQGTAEHGTFSRQEMDALLDLGLKGCAELCVLQKNA